MSTTSRPPEQLSSGSSDSETQENIFGPPPSKMSQWTNRQSQKSTADQWTIANRPDDSPIRQGLDGELEALISMRDQTDEATEEWEKLNYDIHALRYAKREVRARWKKILLQLGYQCEVDALLCVHKQNRFSRDEEHLKKATELLAQLLDHTSLFPRGMGHQNQYLCIMDRLVLLDSAEDFVRLAKEKYPKKEG